MKLTKFSLLYTQLRNINKPVRSAYWYKNILNFGDLLTPEIMKFYGYIPIYRPAQEADIVAVGSILEHLSQNFSGVIAGSGLIHDHKYLLPNADLRAVRGPLTRDNVNAPKNIALGDPGLLANRLINERQNKKYTLGLIPHYADKHNPIIRAILQRYPDEILLIDVQNNPRDVIGEIDRCEHVLSSSLHGMIVADSLGIPTNWTKLSTSVIGDGYKFKDHNLAIGADIKPTHLTQASRLSDILKTMRTPKSDMDPIITRLEQIFSSL